MQVQSLDQEDPLAEEMAYPLQYSCLETPMDREEPRGLQSIGMQRVGQDWSNLARIGITESKLSLLASR